MERFSTTGLPTAGRAAAWSALYAQRMSRGGFAPEDQSQFDAELRIGEIGPVKLAKLSVDGCSFERSQADITQNASRLYSFLLQAKGRSTFYHCGNEAELSEGDFVLCDTGLPHYWGHARLLDDHHGPRGAQCAARISAHGPSSSAGRHLGRAVGGDRHGFGDGPVARQPGRDGHRRGL